MAIKIKKEPIENLMAAKKSHNLIFRVFFSVYIKTGASIMPIIAMNVIKRPEIYASFK
jgi:hypothetical protein